MNTKNDATSPAVAGPVDCPVRLPDEDAAFKNWVRDIPLHERTPWNVWHAAVEWVRRNG
jgi:hypothetical protein